MQITDFQPSALCDVHKQIVVMTREKAEGQASPSRRKGYQRRAKESRHFADVKHGRADLRANMRKNFRFFTFFIQFPVAREGKR